jgi:hypothetical protein
MESWEISLKSPKSYAVYFNFFLIHAPCAFHALRAPLNGVEATPSIKFAKRIT